MIYDILVVFLIIFPYIFLVGMEIYDRTEFGNRRRIKGYSEELIQLLLDVNYNYFKYTIDTWCEIHNKQIVNHKIV